MRMLITGGRDYAERNFLFAVLDRVHAKHPVTLLIEGGATGADRLGRVWAIARGVEYKTCEADWGKYGKRAGFVRNNAMLREEKPDFVVAFRGGRGTGNMVNLANDAHVPVLISWRYEAAWQADKLASK